MGIPIPPSVGSKSTTADNNDPPSTHPTTTTQPGERNAISHKNERIESRHSPSSKFSVLSLPRLSPDAVAGFTAGMMATLVVHPLDILKVRLQLDKSETIRWGRSLNILRNIATSESQPKVKGTALSQGQSLGSSVASSSPSQARMPGHITSSIRALYRGLSPNLIGNSVSWGLYFFLYQEFKTQFARQRENTQTIPSTNSHSSEHTLSPSPSPSSLLLPSDYFVASSAAGLLTVIVTNPVWVLKTRILSSGINTPGAYTNMRSGFRTILQTEGIKGLYRGLVPSLFGVSHGAAQFVVYEMLKGWRSSNAHQEHSQASESKPTSKGTSSMSTANILFCSVTSKVTAAAVTYPYQVVRTRLQTYISSSTSTTASSTRPALSIISDIYRHEGPVGFYKGLGANIVRVLPATCVTFLVYEKVKSALLDSQQSQE